MPGLPAGCCARACPSSPAGLQEHLDDLTLHRIAVTQEQIAQYDLPTKPRKASDGAAATLKNVAALGEQPPGP